MTRPPANLRNGLKWRDGRPRWEPSPANRAAGFRGRDLRDPAGAWLDRGEAIAAADLVNQWARVVREALRDDDAGGAARRDLRRALEALDQAPPPATPEARCRRQLVADLIERGRAVLEGREPGLTVALTRGPRTVQAMIEGYFADADAGRLHPPIAASTRRVYGVQSAKIAARWGACRVDELTRPKLRAWYVELTAAHSLATAAQVMAALGAMMNWATLQDPPWIDRSPAHRLGVETAEGRLVFWTFAEERDFVAWCDGHGFADVGDVVTYGCWTGARQIDLCAATVSDLSGATWRFVPIKTRRKRQEALAGLLQPVKDRLARRLAEVAAMPVRSFNDPPLLWSAARARPHNSESIGQRFREARRLAIAAGVLPQGWDKRLQDTRDTCVTRLFDAGVELSRIPPWTGHSGRDADRILRAHYLTLREAGALDAAAKLEAYARAQGVAL